MLSSVLPLALERSACSAGVANFKLQGAKAFRRCGNLWQTLGKSYYEELPNAATIERLDAHKLNKEIEALAGILHSCVADGASVGFIPPFSLDEARAYWQKVATAVAANETRLLVARVGGEVAGTVQLQLAMPANGRHRGEVAKLLVHPTALRQGIARSLMEAVEELAVAEQRSLLVLDTRTGDNAERLYRSFGWQTAGFIPRYALSTTGELCGTTLMFKTFGIEDAARSI